MASNEVQGQCDPKFAKLKELLAANVASDEELGASICVNIKGKNVVDIWAGHIDEERKQPWEKDSIVNVWSVTKTITNLAALIAVDRGLFKVDDKVSKYWPEFAQNGKEDVEVRHFLSHASGVSAWDQPVTMEDVCDVEKSTAMLAKQAPWWAPGTAAGYHAINQGHLVGELIRRTTGKSLKQFVADELAGPLGADFQIGAQEKDWSRTSTLIPPPALPTEFFSALDPNSPAIKTFTGPPLNALFALSPAWRKGEIGAANGHGNARSVNRIMSAVSLGGEVDGVRLLSPETINLIFQEQSNGIDLCIGQPIRYGIGYGLPNPVSSPWIPEGRRCFWFGWGGSMVLMDLENKMTFSYSMNKMGAGTGGTPRTISYATAVYEALKQ
ncbi:beta-lactamase/transpeptidase-like protein [Acrodontium crateriforme]|uniref:Beta-lactamase/transpeptidase-like protein n=1 Tax=Acrodontium crateriforme TaxID=150365 RepID=A0AAQ3RAN4_9PEZI|nr:beta-lactamase/transpeptidase-like protein [Acrodontium crateriforme]